MSIFMYNAYIKYALDKNEANDNISELCFA